MWETHYNFFMKTFRKVEKKFLDFFQFFQFIKSFHEKNNTIVVFPTKSVKIFYEFWQQKMTLGTGSNSRSNTCLSTKMQASSMKEKVKPIELAPTSLSTIMEEKVKPIQPVELAPPPYEERKKLDMENSCEKCWCNAFRVGVLLILYTGS